MLSDMLKRFRVENGLYQKDLAEMLNTSQAAVSAWERGIRTPTPAMGKKIRDLTGCDASDLVRNPSRQQGEGVAP